MKLAPVAAHKTETYRNLRSLKAWQPAAVGRHTRGDLFFDGSTNGIRARLSVTPVYTNWIVNLLNIK
jgi:hypothetical protein